MKHLTRMMAAAMRVPGITLSTVLELEHGSVHPTRTQETYCETTGRLLTVLEYGELFREEWSVIPTGDGGIAVTRKLTNLSDTVQHLRECVTGIDGWTLGGDPALDYFYHLENPRIYEKFCIPVDFDRVASDVSDSGVDTVAGNRWADPGTVHFRIGRSPYQPFPALLISNAALPDGVVHGSLSQKVFYHCHELSHCDGKLQWKLIAAFKALDWREIQPGEILEDVWYLGATTQAGEIEHLFDGYTRELRRVLPANYGATALNRTKLVWGSWNDGIFRDVYEPDLLEMAEYLQREFPQVAWMQLDDGYAKVAVESGVSHGLGMPYEGDAGVDERRFPHGLKAFFDQVRLRGLRPAIWIGGSSPLPAPIALEHPEWFIDYSYRCDYFRVLDASLPVVRDYMCKALDYLLTGCGCEGMKHDFWSYAFEDSKPLLREHRYSGYELRDWWLKELRKRLASDGYLQTGCDIVMGNPFLGEYFTNYRYGIDIGSGNWEHVAASFLWGSACFATHTGDLIVPNSDAVGLFPGLSDDEAQFCLNYCLITGSMVEIGGYLYRHQDHPRLKPLKKAACCPENGCDVSFVNFDYRAGHRPPTEFFRQGAYFSHLRGNPALPVRTVAVFNLGEEEKSFAVAFADLGLEPGEYFVCDVRDCRVSRESASFAGTLAPHASRLFTVTPVTEFPAVLDADREITGVDAAAKRLTVRFASPGAVELVLPEVPAALPDGFRFDGATLAGTVDETLEIVLTF